MSKRRFIRATEGEPPGISVVYYDTDGNKTIRYVEDYRKAIRVQTKFDMKRTVKSLNDDEYEKLLKAMEVHEGWKEGFEEFVEVKSVVCVRMSSKHVISEYLIKDLKREQWCSKEAAIALAEEGRLHAIVVHAKRGIYLRPEFHAKPFRDLVC
jgi:hypothetical protein